VDLPPDFKKVAICGGCDERFPSVTGWMEEAQDLRKQVGESSVLKSTVFVPDFYGAPYAYLTVEDYEKEVGIGVSPAFKYGFKVARLKEGGHTMRIDLDEDGGLSEADSLREQLEDVRGVCEWIIQYRACVSDGDDWLYYDCINGARKKVEIVDGDWRAAISRARG